MYKRVNELLGTNFKSDKEVNWVDILQSYKLSEDFIEEFSDRLNWEDLSYFQPLTEDFIRRYEDKVNWGNISFSQILTPEFMVEFEDRFDLCDLLTYQPFVDDVDNFKNKSNLINNIGSKLYQETKERGWFIGTVYNFSLGGYLFSYPNEEIDFGNKDNVYLKARIYWKDLVMIDKVKNYEPIRLYRWIQ